MHTSQNVPGTCGRYVVTDPAHVSAAAALRHAYQHPSTRPDVVGLVRDLADYDKAFGLDAEQMRPR